MKGNKKKKNGNIENFPYASAKKSRKEDIRYTLPKPEIREIVRELEKKIQEFSYRHIADAAPSSKHQRRYRSHINASHDRIFIKDDKFRHLITNQALADLFEKNKNDVIGKTDFELMPEEAAAAGQASDMQAITNKTAVISEQRINGRIYETTKFPLSLPNKKNGIGGIVRDITSIRQAEEKLKSSEIKYSAVLGNIEDGYFETDIAGNFTFGNNSLFNIYDCPREELIGMSNRHFSNKENAGKAFLAFNKIYRTQKPGKIFDYEIIRKDGSKRQLEVSAAIKKDSAGKVIGFQGIIRDITERKRMEAHVAQGQKMEAIGNLAGGIAHDFNNILGTVIGFAEMAKDELPGESPVQECIDQIIKASDRAKFLVKQILAFSRRTEVDRKPLLIVPIIKEVVNFLRHALPTTIHIRQEINADNELILADPTQIHQILMNLCMNAGHAMRENGGTLTISLNRLEIFPNNSFVREYLTPGLHVELKVADTGHGIDQSIVNQIFDPFFTTKKKGEGSGMGLAVVHGIVKSYGGHVAVTSEKGKGATFTVHLPAVADQAVPTEDKFVKPIRGGKEKILLIDDQNSILQVMEIMLSRLGYKVTAKQNSLDAMTLFHEDPFAFDMIITDQTMPDLTGSNLAKNALRIRPDIPIILCTGFSDIISADQAKEIGIREYLMKPVTVGDLASTVRNIFEGK